MVLDPVHPQNTRLLERPGGDTLGELAVEGLDGFTTWGGDLGDEPLVLEHFGRTKKDKTGRVDRLESGDEGELLAGGKEVGDIEDVGLLLGVVGVGGLGGAEDGGQMLAGAEDSANAVGEGEEGVFGGAGGEEWGDITAHWDGWGEGENIVGFGGGEGIVGEVVDHEAGAFGGEGDVELGEEGDEGVGGCSLGGEGVEDVALGVEEVDENLGRQVGAES